MEEVELRRWWWRVWLAEEGEGEGEREIRAERLVEEREGWRRGVVVAGEEERMVEGER